MPTTTNTLHSSAASATRFANQPRFGVKRPLWRKDDDHAHLDTPTFVAIRDSVLKRDNFACRFCGFKAARHQEIHHIDGDHQHHDATNLLTVCNLCHQVHHLGMSGMRNAGFIAALPELSQTEVNHIVRAGFVAELLDDQNTRDRLTGLYALMQARADTLKHAFNHDVSSPLLLAEMLASCNEAQYAQRNDSLAALRLVPNRSAFSSGQLDYYAANLKTPFSPSHWAELASRLTA